MPHFAKPFFRSGRNLWYVQLNGRQVNLGPDRDEAFRRYHDLMLQPSPVASHLVVGIIEGFLEWCQKHRAKRTYECHKWHLQRFLDSLPNAAAMTVDEFKPFHVQRWVDSHSNWGKTYRRNAITSVQRAFLWAEKVGHIVKSPVRYIDKPTADRREQVISPETFEAILTTSKGRSFRDLLQFIWETGCRPQEARTLEARHYIPERHRIEFPPAEAKGKKRWRVILLTPVAEAIVSGLAKDNPSGPVFRNRSGRPWTTFAVNCRFCRLAKKLGEKFALYSLRHSFCQRMLLAGNDALTVAALMGHADGSMIARIYSHLEKEHNHLRDALTKANGRASA